MKLYMDDARSAGYCVAGIAAWFKARGLCVRTFIRDGIEYDEVSDDGFAQEIMRVKEAQNVERR